MCRAENRTDKNSHKAEMQFHGEIIGTLFKLVRPLCLMRILFANCSILFCSKIILNLSLLFVLSRGAYQHCSSFITVPAVSSWLGVSSLSVHTQILKNIENSLFHRFPIRFFIHLSARVFSLQLAFSFLAVDFGWEQLCSDG